MFSDHNGIKSQINNIKNFGKSPNICKLSSPWIKEIKDETIKYFKLNINENTIHQTLWVAPKSVVLN